MARKRKPASLAFDALSVEGGLISPVVLARVATRDAGSQTEADYGVPKGLTLRDEIARYFRIGQALFVDLNASPTPSAVRTIGFVEALMRDVFGFADIHRVGFRTVDDRQFPVTLEARDGRVPMVVVPPEDDLDRASSHLPADGRRRSAASAIQDWLNAEDAALWGFCCNGERLRLVRDNASLTRPAYVEANLRQMFEGDDFADFAALWLLVHASRFGLPGTPVSDCPLERWREAGGKEGQAARERLRDGVEAALLALGNGFLAHPQNGVLRDRLAKGELPLPDFFGQLLRLVYRLIFLLAAEDRGLLHPPGASPAARRLYANGYSLSALRDRAVRRAAWDRHHDRWEGVLIVFLGLARGEPRLGLPALGGLFAPGLTSDLETVRLANRALMAAVYRLAWLKDEAGLVPVNWRDMETEELGSVYESLLELTPRLTDDGHGFGFAEGAETKGNARKTSGSFYTPDSLVQLLLDSALDPILDQVEAEADDAAAALLAVTVIDPACGSGHFLLAAARRIATRVARARAGGVASAEDYRHALRDVVRSCIHGVDRNPMAVELTKVALWIETVEPGKPLGFLDANIRCGDSLLGVFDLEALRKGIPEEVYKPLTGDDKETAAHFRKRNASERKGQGTLDFAGTGGKLPPAPPLAGVVRTLRALPEDSVDDIAEKRRRFATSHTDPRFWSWKVACDLYVAAFLAPKIGGAPTNHNAVTIPTTGHVWQVLSGHLAYPPLEARAVDMAGTAGAFHWPLEFPDVMEAGGFDVVLGNPPWEVVQLNEEEYFAQREPEIAELTGAARKRAIARLETDRPEIFSSYQADKRRFEAENEFSRSSGRFELTARGKVNTYALFAELFASLARSRGRAGVIVPTGIATDANTAPFFVAMTKGHRIVSLYSFYEVRGWFKATDDRKPFCVLTFGNSGGESEFAFDIKEIDELRLAERRFIISENEIANINPNTKTAPIFRSRADAKLTAKIYGRVPVLIDETINPGPVGNPWSVDFRQGLFNMTSDSGLFRTAEQLTEAGFLRDGTDWVAPEGTTPRQRPLHLVGGSDNLHLDLSSGSVRAPQRYVPLYEAKMIHLFDHRWASYDGTDSRDVSTDEKADPGFEPMPRYWVLEDEVQNRLSAKAWNRGWLMGWRDIALRSVERTVITTVLPQVAVNHKMPLFFSDKQSHLMASLLANLSTMTLDYVARQKIGGTSLTYFYLKQFPILPPSAYTETDLDFIVPRVLELTYTSHSIASFARDLGYDGPPFAWDEERRARLRAELDAWYARAYGLERDELRYILDPADVKGPDYPSETFRVLKNNEIKRFGEYRTQRLVLEAWDRQERGEVSDTSLPIVVSTSEAKAVPMLVPVDPATLPDKAWAWPASIQPRDRLRYAAQYALWLMGSEDDGSRARFLVACLAEPALLTPWLTGAEQGHWIRLIGPEAQLAQGVTRLRPRINEAWRSMFQALLTSGQLEERADGGWGRGGHFDPAGLRTDSADAQRAAFAIRAIQQIDVSSLTTAVAPEDNVIWMRFGHGGSV